MNTINTEISFVEVWFTDEISKPLETQDNVNLALIIGQLLQKWDIQLNQDLENMLKIMVFCHLLKRLVINMVKNYWILQKRTGIDAAKTTSKRVV